MSFPGVFSLKDLAEQFISYDETFLEARIGHNSQLKKA